MEAPRATASTGRLISPLTASYGHSTSAGHLPLSSKPDTFKLPGSLKAHHIATDRSLLMREEPLPTIPRRGPTCVSARNMNRIRSRLAPPPSFEPLSPPPLQLHGPAPAPAPAAVAEALDKSHFRLKSVELTPSNMTPVVEASLRNQLTPPCFSQPEPPAPTEATVPGLDHSRSRSPPPRSAAALSLTTAADTGLDRRAALDRQPQAHYYGDGCLRSAHDHASEARGAPDPLPPQLSLPFSRPLYPTFAHDARLPATPTPIRAARGAADDAYTGRRAEELVREMLREPWRLPDAQRRALMDASRRASAGGWARMGWEERLRLLTASVGLNPGARPGAGPAAAGPHRPRALSPSKYAAPSARPPHPSKFTAPSPAPSAHHAPSAFRPSAVQAEPDFPSFRSWVELARLLDANVC